MCSAEFEPSRLWLWLCLYGVVVVVHKRGAYYSAPQWLVPTASRSRSPHAIISIHNQQHQLIGLRLSLSQPRVWGSTDASRRRQRGASGLPVANAHCAQKPAQSCVNVLTSLLFCCFIAITYFMQQYQTLPMCARHRRRRARCTKR